MVLRKSLITLIVMVGYLPWAMSEVDQRRNQLAVEYGLSYHSTVGKDKTNGSAGTVTSELSPYWRAAYTRRMGQSSGVRLSGGNQLVKFTDSEDTNIRKEDQSLTSFGIELLRQPAPFFQYSLGIHQTDRILYKAKTANEIEVIKRPFAEPGLGMSLGNRRRVGLQWLLALSGFFVGPSEGDGITTTLGYGGSGQLRLGWVTPAGVVVSGRAFVTTAIIPNKKVDYKNEELGYALVMSYSF